MQALQVLKGLNTDRLDLDDMIYLSSCAEGMLERYKANGMEAPEWLTEAAANLTKEIKAQRRANLELAMKQNRQRRAGLATAEEKRNALDADYERLQKELA